MTEQEARHESVNYELSDFGKALMACQEYAKQLEAMREYIAYLHEAENMTIGLLFSHNWQYPPEFLQKGTDLRAKINPMYLPNP